MMHRSEAGGYCVVIQVKTYIVPQGFNKIDFDL